MPNWTEATVMRKLNEITKDEFNIDLVEDSDDELEKYNLAILRGMLQRRILRNALDS